MKNATPENDLGSDINHFFQKVEISLLNQQNFMKQILETLVDSNPQNTKFTKSIKDISDEYIQIIDSEKIKFSESDKTVIKHFKDQTEHSIRSMKTEVGHLNASITQFSASITALRDEFESVKSRYITSPKKNLSDIRDRDDEIKKIRGEIEAFKSAIDVIRDNTATQEELNEHNQEVKKIQEAQIEQSTKLQKSSDDISTSLNNFKNEQNQFNQKLENQLTAQDIREDFQAFKSIQDTLHDKIQQELDSLKEHPDLLQVAEQLKNEILNDDLKLQLNDLKNQLNEQKCKTDEQISQISKQLNEQMTKTEGQFSQLSNQLNSQKAKADEQISQFSNQFQEKIAETNDQISQLSDQLNSQKVKADEQISQLSNQFKEKITETDDQFSQLSNQLSDRMNKTDDQISQLSNQLSTTQENNNQFTTDYKSKLDDLKQNIQTLSSSHQQLVENGNKQAESIKSIQDEQNNQLSKLQNINETIDTVQSELGDLKSLNDDISRLSATYDEVSQRLTELESKLEQESHHNDIKKQLSPVEICNNEEIDNETIEDTLKRHNRELSVLSKNFILLQNEVADDHSLIDDFTEKLQSVKDQLSEYSIHPNYNDEHINHLNQTNNVQPHNNEHTTDVHQTNNQPQQQAHEIASPVTQRTIDLPHDNEHTSEVHQTDNEQPHHLSHITEPRTNLHEQPPHNQNEQRTDIHHRNNEYNDTYQTHHAQRPHYQNDNRTDLPPSVEQPTDLHHQNIEQPTDLHHQNIEQPTDLHHQNNEQRPHYQNEHRTDLPTANIEPITNLHQTNNEQPYDAHNEQRPNLPHDQNEYITDLPPSVEQPADLHHQNIEQPQDTHSTTNEQRPHYQNEHRTDLHHQNNEQRPHYQNEHRTDLPTANIEPITNLHQTNNEQPYDAHNEQRPNLPHYQNEYITDLPTSNIEQPANLHHQNSEQGHHPNNQTTTEISHSCNEQIPDVNSHESHQSSNEPRTHSPTVHHSNIDNENINQMNNDEVESDSSTIEQIERTNDLGNSNLQQNLDLNRNANIEDVAVLRERIEQITAAYSTMFDMNKALISHIKQHDSILSKLQAKENNQSTMESEMLLNAVDNSAHEEIDSLKSTIEEQKQHMHKSLNCIKYELKKLIVQHQKEAEAKEKEEQYYAQRKVDNSTFKQLSSNFNAQPKSFENAGLPELRESLIDSYSHIQTLERAVLELQHYYTEQTDPIEEFREKVAKLEELTNSVISNQEMITKSTNEHTGKLKDHQEQIELQSVDIKALQDELVQTKERLNTHNLVHHEEQTPQDREIDLEESEDEHKENPTVDLTGIMEIVNRIDDNYRSVQKAQIDLMSMNRQHTLQLTKLEEDVQALQSPDLDAIREQLIQLDATAHILVNNGNAQNEHIRDHQHRLTELENRPIPESTIIERDDVDEIDQINDQIDSLTQSNEKLRHSMTCVKYELKKIMKLINEKEPQDLQYQLQQQQLSESMLRTSYDNADLPELREGLNGIDYKMRIIERSVLELQHNFTDKMKPAMELKELLVKHENENTESFQNVGEKLEDVQANINTLATSQVELIDTTNSQTERILEHQNEINKHLAAIKLLKDQFESVTPTEIKERCINVENETSLRQEIDQLKEHVAQLMNTNTLENTEHDFSALSSLSPDVLAVLKTIDDDYRQLRLRQIDLMNLNQEHERHLNKLDESIGKIDSIEPLLNENQKQIHALTERTAEYINPEEDKKDNDLQYTIRCLKYEIKRIKDKLSLIEINDNDDQLFTENENIKYQIRCLKYELKKLKGQQTFTNVNARGISILDEPKEEEIFANYQDADLPTLREGLTKLDSTTKTLEKSVLVLQTYYAERFKPVEELNEKINTAITELQEKVADIDVNLNELADSQREVIETTNIQSDRLMQHQEMINKQTSALHELSKNGYHQEQITERGIELDDESVSTDFKQLLYDVKCLKYEVKRLKQLDTDAIHPHLKHNEESQRLEALAESHDLTDLHNQLPPKVLSALKEIDDDYRALRLAQIALMNLNQEHEHSIQQLENSISNLNSDELTRINEEFDELANRTRMIIDTVNKQTEYIKLHQYRLNIIDPNGSKTPIANHPQLQERSITLETEEGDDESIDPIQMPPPGTSVNDQLLIIFQKLLSQQSLAKKRSKRISNIEKNLRELKKSMNHRSLNQDTDEQQPIEREVAYEIDENVAKDITLLKREIKNLKQRNYNLDQLEEHLSAIEESQNIIIKNANAQNNVLSKQQTQISSVEADITRLNNKFILIDNETDIPNSDDVKENISDLYGQIDSIQKMLADLTQRFDTHQNKYYQDMDNKFKQEKNPQPNSTEFDFDTFEQLIEKVDQLDNKVNQGVSGYSEREKEIIDTINQHNSSISASLNELIISNNQIVQTINQHEADINELKQGNSEVHSSPIQHQEIDHLKKSIEQINNDLQLRFNEIMNSQNEMKKEFVSIDDIESIKNELDSVTKDDFLKLRNELNSLKENQENDKTIQKMYSKVEKIVTAHQKMVQYIEKLNKDVNTLKRNEEQSQQLRTFFESVKDTINQHSETIKEHDIKLNSNVNDESNQIEKEMIKEQILKLQQSLSECNRTIKSINKQIELMKTSNDAIIVAVEEDRNNATEITKKLNFHSKVIEKHDEAIKTLRRSSKDRKQQPIIQNEDEDVRLQ